MGNVSGSSPDAWLEQLLSEPEESVAARARTSFDRDLRAFERRIVLFGAGNMGRRILARLREDGIEPLAFSDNQSEQWGKTVDGLKVLSPKEAAASYGQSAVFVVTIYNNRHRFPDTREQLSATGCVKVVSVIPVRWKYHETFLPYYHDDLPQRILAQADAIRAAYPLWSDDVSRREYVAQVAWRLHGDFDVLGTPDPEGEYFPPDLIHPRTDEFFVDVGAYDGDTIRKFLLHQRGTFRGAVALEPDARNYRNLLRCISALPAEVGRRIEASALAASNKAGRLRFNNDGLMSAAFSDQGAVEVECVTLDELLRERHPTYIKMDIEGAELDALEGCRQLITEDHPMLAVCVYHTQDHLWKIPLTLRELHPQYRFFLRPHMQECWDTVCYAIPRDRVQ
jgi:FkbM family methyltransferase